MNDPSSVEVFFQFGFTPDFALAREYVGDLLDRAQAVATPDDADPVELLARIAREALEAQGADTIALPVTGGFDSRLLLGVSLELLSAAKVQCFTFGHERSGDCQAMQHICKRLGVRWTRVDPDALDWDLDFITETARDVYREHGYFASPGWIVALTGLSERVPAGSMSMHGYLGGVVSGAHLQPSDQDANARREHIAHCLRHNGTAMASFVTPLDLGPRLEQFLDDLGERVSRFRGLTMFDLLDLGFRQRRRIGAAARIVPNCARPYEDPRWVAYWFSRTFDERFGQAHYRQFLGEAFPHVFVPGIGKPLDATLLAAAPPKPSFWQRLGDTLALPPLARRRAPRPVPPPAFLELGDPRRNLSMQAVIRSCLQSFDRRGIVPTYRAEYEFDAVLDAPSNAAWKRVSCCAAAEVHLRAGNLEPAAPAVPVSQS